MAPLTSFEIKRIIEVLEAEKVDEKIIQRFRNKLQKSQ